jgi:hypothetical protein
MTVGLVGRTIAYVGIIVGLLALGLPYVSSGGDVARYVEDGTIFAFVVVTLAYASYLPAEIGRDMTAAAVGCAAFGFYLFFPAYLAFDRLGYLGSGSWLGLCTILVPIGALIVRSGEPEHGAAAPPAALGTPAQGATALGLILILAGIWLPSGSGSDDQSYWDLSTTLGVLMLLLVLASAGLAWATQFGTGAAGDLALLVAATTFGLVEVAFVSSAFEDFGSLGSGAWLETIGGLLLIVGVASLRRAAQPVHAPAATPATAS